MYFISPGTYLANM